MVWRCYNMIPNKRRKKAPFTEFSKRTGCQPKGQAIKHSGLTTFLLQQVCHHHFSQLYGGELFPAQPDYKRSATVTEHSSTIKTKVQQHILYLRPPTKTDMIDFNQTQISTKRINGAAGTPGVLVEKAGGVCLSKPWWVTVCAVLSLTLHDAYLQLLSLNYLIYHCIAAICCMWAWSGNHIIFKCNLFSL